MKFVFQVKIKDGYTEQEYIDAWKKGSEIIQKSKGAQGTILYKKIGDPMVLLAIATWESKEIRDAGMKKLHDTRANINEDKSFGDINILGHFEEVARVEP